MDEVTVRLPKRIILDLLRQIPKDELEELMREPEGRAPLQPVRVASKSLDRLTGIISVGGDAVQETEEIYE